MRSMMDDNSRAIFRPDAVRHYLQAQEQAVLPRVVRPRLFLLWWILIGLALAGTLVLWLARVPIYVAGSAIFVDGSVTHTASAPIGIVGFLPPEQLSHLRTGQHVFVRLSPTGERLSSSITAIDPAIISPAVAQQRFKLSTGAAQTVTQASGVVFVSPVPLPAGVPGLQAGSSFVKLHARAWEGTSGSGSTTL